MNKTKIIKMFNEKGRLFTRKNEVDLGKKNMLKETKFFGHNL